MAFTAIDYVGSNGVFTQLGKHIYYSSTYNTLGATTLPADFAAIAAGLEAGNAENRRDLTAMLTQLYNSAKDGTVAWRRGILDVTTKRLLDRTTLLNRLSILKPNDVQSVLSSLHAQMVADAQTIKGNTVTLGAVTASASNIGNPTVVVDKVLDGFSSPGFQMPALVAYNGLNSELSATETETLVCLRDSQKDGLVEGEETWSWFGQPNYGKFSWQSEGSGINPNEIRTHNWWPIVKNRVFESWSANQPTNWNLGTGTLAGTHVFQETTAANVRRGKSAVKFVADAALATIQIDYDVAASLLTPRTRYYLSIWYMADALVTAGTWEVLFTGTGYTAGSSEKVSIASLATSLTRVGFYWNTPAKIPSDLKLVIRWTGTPAASGKRLWFDDLSFGPVYWWNGINLAVIAADIPPKVADRFTFDVTNNKAGKFQEYVRQGHGIQLPSKTDATETIADTLVAA